MGDEESSTRTIEDTNIDESDIAELRERARQLNQSDTYTVKITRWDIDTDYFDNKEVTIYFKTPGGTEESCTVDWPQNPTPEDKLIRIFISTTGFSAAEEAIEHARYINDSDMELPVPADVDSNGEWTLIPSENSSESQSDNDSSGPQSGGDSSGSRSSTNLHRSRSSSSSTNTRSKHYQSSGSRFWEATFYYLAWVLILFILSAFVYLYAVNQI